MWQRFLAILKITGYDPNIINPIHREIFNLSMVYGFRFGYHYQVGKKIDKTYGNWRNRRCWSILKFLGLSLHGSILNCLCFCLYFSFQLKVYFEIKNCERLFWFVMKICSFFKVDFTSEFVVWSVFLMTYSFSKFIDILWIHLKTLISRKKLICKK